ncbi:hypothetical protein [Pedobacter gandavensis]|uniref:TonB-dependent receptor n=1 Tax=Pedobacter gandavensis TaxID=2679963 RepID=A0ABR6EVW3_9SPHI|nr:hypothetical protein [Pedobacter gandavensis]MBB2148588.1 hypothetical protein [Pedobacter gandavensis]
MERFTLNLNASKYIYALSTTAKFNIDVNFSNQNILQNGNLQDYKNNNYTLSLVFDSKMSEKFNFNLEGRESFGSAKTTSALQPFQSSSRSGQYKTTLAYQFQKTMIAETNFEYQYFRAIGGKTNYFFNEAKVTYTQPKSKTAYILGLSNTFNVRSLISQSIDANSDFYQEYFLRPRVIYLSVKFLL